MKLYINCSSCKKDISIKSQAVTRPDLQMEKGETINVNCKICGTVMTKHINDIKAEPNNTVIFIGVGIGILATIVLWSMFGAIGAVSIIIPLLFWQQQSMAVKAFNSYRIRRK